MNLQRYSLPVRLVPPMILTYAVAAWCISVLGTERFVPLLVITFAWSIVTARQLVAVSRRDPQPFTARSLGMVAGGVSGQLLWIAVPLLHAWYPDSPVWLPVEVAPGFAVLGFAIAVAWPLYPFWAPRVGWSAERLTALGPMVDARILCGAFFLLSGQVVFAVIGVAALINNDAEPLRRKFYESAPATWQPTLVPTES